ncbi:hypothetical protein EWM64_g154 [Hericium alpestre]|uniref:G domain-containing protein n=1 Tax=Hericium alpestre TaxID=135208 RepID=A0A4Z0ABU1_9AGAM|nr:hypothetical protein EWM64_g154 [Hericium alpestre]
MQLSAPFQLDGHTITLIDSPGFDDTIRSDTDVLKQIATFLSEYYEKGMMLTGVIYMYSISDRRMTGVSRRNFNMFRQLCGDSTLKNVAIVTNMWEELTDRTIGENREAELRDKELFFKPVLEKGAVLLRHEGTLESGQLVLQYLIENSPQALKIQRELVDEHLHISETAASTTLSSEIMEQAEKHRQELREVQEEMRAAIKAKDEQTSRELEVESRKLQNEVTRLQNESTKLATEFKAMQEKASAEYASQMQALQTQFRLTSIDASQERQTLQKQMNDLREQCIVARPQRGQEEGASTRYFNSWGFGRLRYDFKISESSST